MHVARHPTRHLPRCDRARIEKRAINGGARRPHAATDAGRAHARTLTTPPETSHRTLLSGGARQAAGNFSPVRRSTPRGSTTLQEPGVKELSCAT
jgi:hypothetical protein